MNNVNPAFAYDSGSVTFEEGFSESAPVKNIRSIFTELTSGALGVAEIGTKLIPVVEDVLKGTSVSSDGDYAGISGLFSLIKELVHGTVGTMNTPMYEARFMS